MKNTKCKEPHYAVLPTVSSHPFVMFRYCLQHSILTLSICVVSLGCETCIMSAPQVEIVFLLHALPLIMFEWKVVCLEPKQFALIIFNGTFLMTKILTVFQTNVFSPHNGEGGYANVIVTNV